MTRQQVAVVGAGVIGAAIAWAAVDAGFAVTVVDPRPRSGASWVAGGMLAPITEAWPGEERLLELGAASLESWPDFARRLTGQGAEAGLRGEGTVVGAVDSADRAELDRVASYLAALDREVEVLTGRELRVLEPCLGRAVRAGLSVPGDLAVDNRTLLDSLLRVGAERGVVHRAEAASAVRTGGVELACGEVLACDIAIIAAGAASGALHPRLAGALRPVKGEILRLAARAGSLPPPKRTVRGLVQGRHAYLVPRDNGGLVLGATEYEAGFETGPRVSGVRDLLADAELLMPAIADYELLECAAGLRPGSVDNLPVLGWLAPGVLAATGHGRNGILLTPVTVDTVLALLRDKPVPEPAAFADPARLEGKTA
ncbi:MAG TPA: glycine oxidase ThiO [Pseudonocardiaceae bacterium]|jgi:glycine oxidase|nr:glycine oxidase ThiO [Pseudonocardiaceae bacterium]